MTQPLAYRNGQFISGPLAVPVSDAGFVFGATVTDLVRTFSHKLFRFDDHLARFRASCELCRVPLPIGDDELRQLPNDWWITTHQRELALVMLATPGPIGHYVGSPESGPPTLMMHTFPLPSNRYRKLFTDGATLVVPPTKPTPSECIDPRAKMRSRMHWWIAEQQAHDVDPSASALLVDRPASGCPAGHVTETAAANFLIVKDGMILTPPRDTVLNGISLQVVEELCGELGIPFAERPLTIAECQSADEAMLTCTSYCVAGVRRLDGVELPWPGPVWRRLIAAWSEGVGVDIAAQIIQ